MRFQIPFANENRLKLIEDERNLFEVVIAFFSFLFGCYFACQLLWYMVNLSLVHSDTRFETMAKAV